MQNYKIDILTYFSDGSVRSDCADIAFQNVGTTDVLLNNGFTLPAGSFLSFTANDNELDNTIYNFSFINGVIGSNQLTVIRKVYI